MNWISVDDGLPEYRATVIAYNEHKQMMIGIYSEWGWTFPAYFENVTHWMPLPEPPKEEV